VRAACSSDQSFALVYVALGQSVTLNLEKVMESEIHAWWYNPRNGDVVQIEEMKSSGIKEFTPPTSGWDNDWMLVLDSKKAQLQML